jgi:hypothetical protein
MLCVVVRRGESTMLCVVVRRECVNDAVCGCKQQGEIVKLV